MKPTGVKMSWSWVDIKDHKKYGKNCASCRAARRVARIFTRAKKRHENAAVIQKALKEID